MKKLTLITYALLFAFMGSLFANEVNIFSARHYDSDVQLYEKFTSKTGIKVNVVSGKSGALEKRIIDEGADSQADLYITADAGRLGAFAAYLQGGLTSSAIKSAVPSNFRTSKWVGIAKRERIIYSEQYPKGLGNTVNCLKKKLTNCKSKRIEKTTFSVFENKDLKIFLNKNKIKQVIILGIESHICVLQTAIDLLKNKVQVYIVEECVGSRKLNDSNLGVRRMLKNGASVFKFVMRFFG